MAETYHGVVKSGVVVPSQNVSLPDGLNVTIVASFPDNVSEEETSVVLSGTWKQENVREAWLALSSESERAICDNPIDAEDWDHWKPSRSETRRSWRNRHREA